VSPKGDTYLYDIYGVVFTASNMSLFEDGLVEKYAMIIGQ
jgi:hypothetical protein